jgi:predicted ATPase/class 3 adenylate cyclase
VTFLFTDIEGSTRLEQAVGSGTWAELVADHDRVLREAIEAAGGAVVKTEGDAFFAAFASPGPAIEAIVAGQRALASRDWPGGVTVRVRAGLHLGDGRIRHRETPADPEDYVGIDVNYAARISNAANGGQVVLSDPLRNALGAELGTILARTDAHVLDEGLRRVKDFDEPARLHRLVIPGAADDRRPLRTLEVPSNLPREATSLIGRETDIERLAGALRDNRVVTLTGPGGSGKTRLAVGVADAVRDRFPHGTWFIDLAAVRDPALLEVTVAAVLGVRDSTDQPTHLALASFLRDRLVLLVLDNVEQLLPEAARRVATLIRASASLFVLTTTRELLRINGEYGYLVPPLAAGAGMDLFEDRARLQRPGMTFDESERTTIAAICERLAGLPLAIELAAARVRLLPVAAILERLGRSLDLAGGARDLPERQRTLRGAIDWSHDLLSEAEARLFRRLSVFAGGWTAATALQVVDRGDLGGDLLGLLESLIDKSLARVDAGGEEDGPAELAEGDVRFSFHPLLREYGAERLEAAGERDELEAAHAAVFVEVAERAGARFMGPESAAALRELDREQHNLRAAVEYLIRTNEVAPAIRMVAATWRWFQQRGRLGEGRALLGALLDRPESRDDVRIRIAGLEADGGLAYWMENMADARERYDERLGLAEETGDPRILAAAHYDIAFTFMVAEEVEPLAAHAERALELYTALDDEMGVLRSSQALNLANFLRGDFEAARAREEENLAVFSRKNLRLMTADSITLLSAIDYRLGDGAAAWARLLEGLHLFAELDMASGLARSLGMAALVQLRFGDAELGARIAGTTLELGRTKKVMVAPTRVLHLPALDALAVERLGEEEARDLMAEGAAIPVGEMIDRVLAASAPGSVSDAPRAPS